MPRLSPILAALAAAVLIAGPPPRLAAQPLDPTALPPADALSDEAEVSIVTIGRGDDAHTLFGHTAVIVVDPPIDLAVAFNYGTFDFGEGFVLRFLRGDLDYHLSVAEGEAPLREAVYFGRGYAVQWLDLSSTQVRDLYRELRLEAQPANRTYRYRFLDRNCSTKVVDVLDRALGDAIVWPSTGGDAAAPGATYRDLLRGHLRDRPWYRLGIDTILGQPVDRELTPKQRGFLPLHLMELLDGTLILTGGGDAARPIVASRRGEGLAPLPTRDTRHALWAAVGLLAVAAMGTLAGRKRPGAMKWPMRVFDGVLVFGAGLAGVVIVAMWAGSKHGVIGPNWHLLWAWPTHVVAAAWIVQRPGLRWLRVYLGVAGCVAVAAIVASVVVPQGWPAATTWLAAALGVRGLDRSGWFERGGSESTTTAEAAA